MGEGDGLGGADDSMRTLENDELEDANVGNIWGLKVCIYAIFNADLDVETELFMNRSSGTQQLCPLHDCSRYLRTLTFQCQSHVVFYSSDCLMLFVLPTL